MKIAILGYGKMGKVIEEIALKRGHVIDLKVDTSNLNFTTQELMNCDIAIEFSSPNVVVNNIYKCFEADVPVVVGTTGWYNTFDEVLRKCEESNQSLLTATNFSIGVNIFYEINNKLASLMNKNEQYDVGIEEIHHTQKLDAPSGTAISLADGVIENLDRKNSWKNKLDKIEGVLNIESKRIENVPGTHIVKYDSDVDCIEIKHEAKNRKGFALGAVIAAEFLMNKKGVYTMKDVLSF